MQNAAMREEIDETLKSKLVSQKMMSELISLCSSQMNPGEFLSSFLSCAVRLVEASGGGVWVKREDRFEPAFNTGECQGILPSDDAGEGGEEGVLHTMSQDPRPYVFPMISADGGNGGGIIGIYVPIEVDDGLFAVMKVIKKTSANVVYQEEIELLQNMGGLVRLYLNQLHLPKVLGRMEEIQKLFQVNTEIFSSLDAVKVAYSVVNLVPSVVRCDRCIAGLVERGSVKIRAITGQDFVEKKSAAVRNLREILQYVADRGEAMTITPEMPEEETDEAFQDAVTSYFKVQPFRIMRAIPVKDDKEQVLGVISIEASQESVFAPNDLAMFQFVSTQAGISLKNARLYKQIPFAKTWHALGGLKEKLAAMPRFKLIAASALILLVIGAILFWKVDHKISADCEVLPLVNYYGRARIDGILKEFLVKEGDRVKAGSVVALLDDTEIQRRLREAGARLAVTKANMLKHFGSGEMAEYGIEELRMKGIEKEIELLESDMDDTRIMVEGSGVVLTPNPRFAERLGKPVAKGEELVEVGKLDELLLAVAVSEGDIQYVRPGQSIRFLLNALPEKHFDVTVDTIRQRTEPRPEGNFIIVESTIDVPNIAFRPGMKGKAKIYTDKAPIWKVYLRDMIDFFRVKVLF